MNIRLHRKQIFILGIAMMLAVASFWIPSPQRPAAPGSESGLSEPIGRSVSAEAIAFAREPATTQRFPVAEQIPQTAGDVDSSAKAEHDLSADSLPATQFLDPRDLANGDSTQLGTVLVVPVKNPDQPSKR